MRYVLLVLALGVMSAGCASTHRLMPNAPDGTYGKLEELARKHTATIRLRTGQQFKARPLYLRGDSLFFDHQAYALHEVETIRFRRRGAGLWRGMLIGSVAGLVPPVLVLTSGCEGLGCLLVPIVAIVVGVYTIPIGLIGGGLIGYLHGYVDTFEVVTSPSSKMSVAPPETKKGSAPNRP